MKQLTFTHFFSLAIVALLVSSAAAQTDGTPKIVFDHQLYDFGETSLVDSVTGTFTFHNAGDGVLEVEKPKPVCGCTVASVSPSKLNPGDKGELVFTLQLGAPPHKVSKQVFLPTNDPKNRSVQLDIAADLKKTFEVQPGYLRLNDLRVGGTNTSTVAMKRVDGKPLKIVKVETSAPWIAATFESPAGSTDETAVIHVVVTPTGQPRQLNDRVFIYTPDKNDPAVTVTVSAILVGDVKVVPAILFWNFVGEKVRTRILTVSATQTDHPVKVHDIVSSIPELKVEATEVKPGQQFQLAVTMTTEVKETTKGTITFETDIPSMPKIEVPVQVTVHKP